MNTANLITERKTIITRLSVIDKKLHKNGYVADISLNKVIDNVCLYCQVDRDDLMDKNREDHIFKARAICFYILRYNSDHALKRIGHFFDKDHATVLHGLKRIEEWLLNDKFKQLVEDITLKSKEY